jgi:hypothetical protein
VLHTHTLTHTTTMESKHASSSTFDGKVSGLLAVVKQYVDKMIAVKGMKALVMDEDTMRILGVVYSLSEVISKVREEKNYVVCVCVSV